MEHLFWKHHQFNKVIVDPGCTLSGWTSRMYFMWNRIAIGNIVLKYTRSQFSSATVFLNWVYRYMCKVPSIVWPDMLSTLNSIKCDSRFVLHFWRIYIMSPSDPNDLLYLIWMLQHTFHCLNFLNTGDIQSVIITSSAIRNHSIVFDKSPLCCFSLDYFAEAKSDNKWTIV